MLKMLRRTESPTSTVGFTIRSTLRMHNQEIGHVQYATEHYVVTRADRVLLLFWAARGERFHVDSAHRVMRRIDLSAQHAQLDRLRPLVGKIHLADGGEEEEIGGFRCRRCSLHNESSEVVITGESYYTRIAGLERTALAADRDFDARSQLFRLPLGPDEVVVLSTCKTLSQGFEQNQRIELVAIEDEVEDLQSFDEFLTYPILG